jgi:hypothetical protein
MTVENETNKKLSHMEVVWGVDILEDGFCGIPNIVVRYHRKAGVTPAEWSLITVIFTHKHDHKDPFPSQERIAGYLGISERGVRKLVDSLEEKKLVEVGQEIRDNGTFGNMVYRFNLLLEACLKLWREDQHSSSEPAEKTIRWRHSGETQPAVLQVPAEEDLRYQRSGTTGDTGTGPQVPPKRTTEKDKPKRQYKNNNKKNSPNKEFEEKASVVVEFASRYFSLKKETVLSWLENNYAVDVIQHVITYASTQTIRKTPEALITSLLPKGFDLVIVPEKTVHPSDKPSSIKRNLIPDYIETPYEIRTKDQSNGEDDISEDDRKHIDDLMAKLGEK